MQTFTTEAPITTNPATARDAAHAARRVWESLVGHLKNVGPASDIGQTYYCSGHCFSPKSPESAADEILRDAVTALGKRSWSDCLDRSDFRPGPGLTWGEAFAAYRFKAAPDDIALMVAEVTEAVAAIVAEEIANEWHGDYTYCEWCADEANDDEPGTDTNGL